MIYRGITVDLTIRGMLISGKTSLFRRSGARSDHARLEHHRRAVPPRAGPHCLFAAHCLLLASNSTSHIAQCRTPVERDLTIRLQPEDGCASLKAPPVPLLALHTFKTEAMSRGGTLNASRHQPLAGILARLGR